MQVVFSFVRNICALGAQVLFSCVELGAQAAEAFKPSEWPIPAGNAGAQRYSPLTDINRSNVKQLKVAWTYRHGDYRSGWPDPFKGTAFQASPIVVDNRLIFPTPFNRVIALDPETGRELWAFDPKIDKSRRFANLMVNRGVSFWRVSDRDNPCAKRIFLATLDARLIALDFATGKRCTDFGVGGEVNLLAGIENLVDDWEFNVTSPPTVIGNVVVVGSSLADEVRRIQPSGAVRAFDAVSGKLLWRFNTIPQPGEFGNETWEQNSSSIHGGANVWSTITADEQRGLIFLPVSTAGPDFIGVDRPGANLFVDSVVALKAQTGERVWHFQTTHHDLWDYDLAAPPMLASVKHNGKVIDAVVQGTKTGFVFVLNRDTGMPLFPVEEKPMPESDIQGEVISPTQPIPTKPPTLVPQQLTEKDLWADDPKHHAACLKRFRELRSNGLYTPPSQDWTILYPGTAGGINWSGGAMDPVSGVYFVPTRNDVHLVRLNKLPDENFATTDGKIMSSVFAALRWARTREGTGLRYGQLRDTFMVNDLPCHKPPWGMLHAVDLNSGEIRWQVPIGEDKRLGVRGLPNFGPPLVTAGRLIFHAGTKELVLRAYDTDTGAVLASFDIPAGLHAGPITYKLRPNGKQYLVIAPGGHKRMDSKLGDYIIAYALP